MITGAYSCIHSMHSPVLLRMGLSRIRGLRGRPAFVLGIPGSRQKGSSAFLGRFIPRARSARVRAHIMRARVICNPGYGVHGATPSYPLIAGEPLKGLTSASPRGAGPRISTPL